MSDTNEKPTLARKPSIKNKKPPEVKQTLTSKYRLLKSNPLLMKAIASKHNEKDKEKILINKPLKTLAKALGNDCEILNENLSLENGLLNGTRRQVVPKTQNNRKIEIFPRPKTGFNHSNSSKIDFTSDHLLSSTVIESRRESVLNSKKYASQKTNSGPNFNKFLPNQSTTLKTGINGSLRHSNINKSTSLNRSALTIKTTTSKAPSTQIKSNSNLENKKVAGSSNQHPNQTSKEKPKPLRRSLSAQQFDKKKKEIVEQLHICNAQPTKTQSLQTLNEKATTEEHHISTINEESFTTPPVTPTLAFRTPKAYDRRSIKTPNTTNNRRSLFLSTPTRNELSERLSQWLKRRGKSLGDFHHLKCFGIHGQKPVKVVNEEDKENFEANPCIPCSSSYENLKISKPAVKEEAAEATPCNKIDLELVAKEAVQDLHKLILEGYPSDQCESWLKLIKQKYTQLEEDPQYWECRAALEQTKGNLNLAVECYKTAIIQGAEIQAVDESLDQLLQKFSLLNINSKTANAEESRDRARIVRDARNIFKSSIIQFAVRERILKKKSNEGVTIEKKLIATPVRRSTRLSRSAYTSTPGVKIYSSLQEVDGRIRDSISFVQNKALRD